MSLIRTNPQKSRSTLDRKSLLYQKIATFMMRHTYNWVPSTRKYNLSISEKHRFVWFRVAKAATRTIFNTLKYHDINLDADHPMRLYYPTGHYRDYFKFAIVRNPWDRLVSCWHDKVVESNQFKFTDSEYQEMQNFESFVNYVQTLNIDHCNVHIRSQSSLVDLNHIDFIGRLESFDRDLDIIMDKIGIDLKKTITRNQTTNRDSYKSYYTKSLARKVEEIYSRDVQIFGYQFSDHVNQDSKST